MRPINDAGQLAEAADIAVETLSRIERACMSPSVEMLERLASGLEVPVESMFSAEALPQSSELRPAERSMLSLLRRLDHEDAARLVKAVRSVVEIGARVSRIRSSGPRGKGSP